jgi:hypothetical protein
MALAAGAQQPERVRRIGEPQIGSSGSTESKHDYRLIVAL